MYNFEVNYFVADPDFFSILFYCGGLNMVMRFTLIYEEP